jgi:hypothetical protein
MNESNKPQKLSDSKVEIHLCSSFKDNIEKAVRNLEENGLDVVEIPNSSGQMLIRLDSGESAKREKIPMAFVFVSRQKRYLVSSC